MSEQIEKSYLNSESRLNAEQRRYLVYPDMLLVPCKLEQEKDSYKLIFDTTGLNAFGLVKDLPVAERYRVLVNAAALEEIRAEYAFSLDPENLMLDVNLGIKVLERDIADNAVPFVDQYCALIGSVVLPSYRYADFLQGGGGLYGKHDLLKRIKALETTEEICAVLSEAAAEI